MDALLSGLLCSAPCWLLIVLWLAARTGVRWSEETARRLAAVEAERVEAELAEVAELDRLRAKFEDAAKAQAIIARVEALDPPAEPPPEPGRPPLRLIRGGPDAEPPTDLQVAAEPPEPPADGGPPLLPDERMVNLGPPDGPTLTVWQRNLVRSAIGLAHVKVPGLDLKQLTTKQAEKLMAELGANPKKLYTGGRAWGQKRQG